MKKFSKRVTLVKDRFSLFFFFDKKNAISFKCLCVIDICRYLYELFSFMHKFLTAKIFLFAIGGNNSVIIFCLTKSIHKLFFFKFWFYAYFYIKLFEFIIACHFSLKKSILVFAVATSEKETKNEPK